MKRFHSWYFFSYDVRHFRVGGGRYFRLVASHGFGYIKIMLKYRIRVGVPVVNVLDSSCGGARIKISSTMVSLPSSVLIVLSLSSRNNVLAT